MTRWCIVVPSLLTFSALAGNPPPTFVMVNSVSESQYPWLDPDAAEVMTPMVLASAYNYGTGGHLAGAQVAFYVANQIIARRNGQGAPLPDGTICICITSFGRDDRDCAAAMR